MKAEQKPDAAAICQRLRELRTESWLGNERQLWPRYLFHFSDITNIVKILNSGELLSRKRVKQDDFQDSASREVIDHTAERWKDYARFYFRPKTPTLWHNEGFRTRDRIRQQKFSDAHCPVPIYLLFDAEAILSRADSKFSFGSLARSSTQVFASASDFMKLPFESIYHTGTILQQQDKDRIIFHRQAEVIVPERVGLEHLKYIWCRSQAEYETLYYRLSPGAWNKWRNNIMPRTDRSLFHRKMVYVDKVTLTSSEVIFDFNQPESNQDRGPFSIFVGILETFTGTTYTWSDDQFMVGNKPWPLDLSNLTEPEDYRIRLTLDGNLAYENRYQKYDQPF